MADAAFSSSSAVPPGNCVTHGYHGRTFCPRCSTSALPPPPLTQGPSAALIRHERIAHPHEHELKTWPTYFKDVLRGDKNFEVRRDDRAPMFRQGDTLVLREWDERSGYSGDKLWRRITYVLPGGQFGIEPGYCVLGLGLMDDA